MGSTEETRGGGRARLSWLPSTFLAACAAAAGGACLVAPRLHLDPVQPQASAALLHSEELRRSASLPGHADDAAAARAELERALQLEPGWVAPQRLLDDLEREELRGAEALERERAQVAAHPGDAAALYLAGRLEGREGVERFELARRADPNLAWACNGLAWAASAANRSAEALMYARAALARARETYERGYFEAALVRMLLASGRRDEALERIEARLSAAETPACERVALRVLRASNALASSRPERVREGYDEGLRLLGEEPLSEHEIADLAALLQASTLGEASRLLELASALSRGTSPERDRLRARILLETAPSPLALGLLQRAEASQGGPVESSLLRAARFAAGEGREAVELWLGALPSALRDEDGLPRDERLRAVVQAARALAAGPDSGANEAALGDALCEAGWFLEAREVAGALARSDLERALALDARALAAISAFSGLRRCLVEVDRERAGAALLASISSGTGSAHATALRDARAPVRDLDGLLARLDELLVPTRVAGGLRGLSDSPRLSFGMVGELVHPGPRYSKADAQAGLGAEGAAVGGLAAELLRLHRFGIFGEMSGSGPDGAVLPLLSLETRSGKHLGVPWSGTVALCESADLEPQAARAGAGIAGAALHEGYWLDIDSLRVEQAHWRRLASRFEGPQGLARRAELLAFTGLALEAHDEDELSRLRRAQGALLGEGERVRLARIAAGGVPTLDEFIDVAGMHEEGHLCDRTRFLPLSQHLPRALGFLIECGASPQRVMQRLEYRAQLVALCDAPDARIPLAQLLDAAETGPGSGLTPHAAAYADLLGDMLAGLDRELLRDPRSFPHVDPARSLAQQLHRLDPQEVRGLARRVAQREGLDKR